MRDPSAALERARDEIGEFFYSDALHAYVVLGYEEIVRVLMDNDKFSRFGDGQRIPEKYRDAAPTLGYLRDLMVISDPPQHTNTRRMMSEQFRPVKINALADGIDSAANELIDTFIGRGSCELMGEYAYALTYRTLALLLDVPRSEFPRLTVLARDTVALIGDALQPIQEPDFSATWDRWMDARGYLEGLVAERAENPGDDLISLCARNLGNPGAPTVDKIVTDMCGMIAAGADTTALTIAHGAALLSEFPHQLAVLSDDPSLWQNGVEELMRRHGSIPAVVRVATTDAEIQGVRVPVGASVVCYLASGSADAEHFAGPIGAPLGRLQARIGLRALFDRIPEIRPKHEQHLHYTGTIVVPALRSYDFEWDVIPM